MRVLHIIPSVAARTGGPASALGAYVDAARTVGIACDIWTTNQSGTEVHATLEGASVRMERCWGPAALAFSPGLLRRLLIDAGPYDVLHVHALWRPHGAGSWLASMLHRVPMIVRPCGMLSRLTYGHRSLPKRLYMTLVEKRVLDHAAAIHYTTRKEQEHSVFRSSPHRPPIVVPPPVPCPPLEARESARRALQLKDHQTWVVSVGRGDPIKRPEVLIRALRYLQEDTALALVGDYPARYRTQLTELARSEGISSDRLRFSGHVDRDGLGRWLSAADVFATASEHENFGVAIVEACLAGLPVVLPKELAIARELGSAAVAVERAPRPIADALAELSGPERRIQTGERGRALATTRWSERAVAPQLLEMYQRVASRPS